MSKFNRFGPGILVTAAFIGPGTITTASSAGAHFGFALIWALVFSIFATIILQEMSARLGLVTREGLAEAMRSTFESQLFGGFSVLLVVAAVGFGQLVGKGLLKLMSVDSLAVMASPPSPCVSQPRLPPSSS